MHIKAVRFKENQQTHYPYYLPFFGKTINFTSNVTILVGDNGCGKSTFLKLLKNHLGLYQIGEAVKKSSQALLEVSVALKKPKGYYFSSEDFTMYINQLEENKKESHEALDEIETVYKNRSIFAKNLASMPHKRTLAEIDALHDKDLSLASHGESYLSFFKSRLKANQLMLLDEPETPLSFHHQLSLLYLLHEAVKDNCQIIIATHSPIIMAYPNAQILKFEEGHIEAVTYESLESVQLLKRFLDHPDIFIKRLFE
ncbi:AAA family ATPase [Liberiplasma polymorphum]|uniref:AAA family ATPase n=1 Tax=Liberiplasma polymorphum TaxID=3374570 RepID=UPI003771BBC2